jgi:predicted membrane protein
MDLNPKRSRGGLAAGVIIISVGVLLLLNQLGVLPHRIVVEFWPAVLAVIGLVKLTAGPCQRDRVVGLCMLVAGVLLQTNSLGYTHITWNEAWPLFIIFAGVMLLVHSVSSKEQGPPSWDAPQDRDSFFMFGGGERKISTKDFRGARLFALFGGYEIDLTHADIAGSEAFIEASAVFGGGEIRVPTTWKVVVQGTGILGGYSDDTQHFQPDPNAPVKTLYVRGVAVFGGVEVRN